MKKLLSAAVVMGACALAHAGVMSHMTVAPATPQAPKKYDAATVKAEELKGCLVDAYSIDEADAVFDAARPKMEAEREELKKLRDAAAGAPTNANSAAGKELRERTRAFNARIAELNSRVAYAQDARDRFSRLCKGRRYYADDFTAARDSLPVEVRNAHPPK
jgi:hypothetical protein